MENIEEINRFVKTHNLLYLKNHTVWGNYLGSAITFQDDHSIKFVNYSKDLQPFSVQITPYDLNNGSMLDFKDYLELRMKCYRLFKQDSKAAISKLVALYNMRSTGHKFHHKWWEYTYN